MLIITWDRYSDVIWKFDLRPRFSLFGQDEKQPTGSHQAAFGGRS